MTDKTLKALAEAATQGEWFVHEPYTHAIFSADFHIANAFEERDLAYIVAAHPAAILAILDQHAAEIAAKDARIKELEEERDAANDRTVKMIETVQRMRRAGEDLAVRLRAALAGTDTPEKAKKED